MFSGKRAQNAAGAEEDAETARSQQQTDVIIPWGLLKGQIPTYFHIGLLAKECLVTGFDIDSWRLDCRTQLSDKIILYFYGNGQPYMQGASGGVGIKEQFESITLSQGLTTEGILGTIEAYSEFSNSKLNSTLRCIHGPYDEPKLTVDFRCCYEQSPFKFEVFAPTLQVPKAMGYLAMRLSEKIILGYRTVYDFNERAFEKNAFGVGYNNEKTELSLKLEDFQDLRASIFQRLGERWAIALKGDLRECKSLQCAIGGQYLITEDILVKLKIYSDGYFGFVYQQILSEKLRCVYHLGFQCNDPLNGYHKIGVSWSFTT